MYVRPHLDYCDIIYHIPVIKNDFDSSLTLNYQMNALERTQYQAALAVSGTWKGTNRNKIYEELGWETLDQRRSFRRLVQFYKIMNDKTPDYLKIPIQSLQRVGHRSTNVIDKIFCRTDKYLNSFFPDSVIAWNGIGPLLRGAISLSIFKKNILKSIRPVNKSLFNIHNPNGISRIFQLRVGLSPLKSHKKSHGFHNTPDDLCACLLNAETTQHFLLKCPNYNEHRHHLFQILNPIMLANDINQLQDRELVRLVLYGHEKFSFHENQILLKATMNFLVNTSRFS